MSFINMADNDYSSEEEDADYVPNEVVSDDENGNESVDENQQKEEDSKLEKNKEEAKKIWEEMKLEANSSSVSNKTATKVKSPSNLTKKESTCSEASKSGSSMTSAATESKKDKPSTNLKSPALSLNIVSDGFENNTLFGLKPKPAKKGGLDLNDIMKGPGQAKRKSGGLNNVLSAINKKPKLTTLEKSKLDWMQFKKDEDIEEELTSFSKSKEGYVERLNFLERTDQRQFELEKQIRLKKQSKR